MDVRIQRFQSIDDQSLTIEGFTVLTGPTDTGKSSVMRAIEGAFHNFSGDFFVREGCQYCRVDVACDELELTWKKGRGSRNDYVIDGKDYKKVGRGVPDVVEDHGFYDIDLNRKTLSPQFGDQFRPIFLISDDVSGSEAAELISDIGRLNQMQEALRAAESDRRAYRQKIQVRQEDLQTLESSLEGFQSWEQRDRRQWEDLQSKYEALQSQRQTYHSFRDMTDRYRQYQAEMDILEPLEDDEGVSSLQSCRERWDGLRALTSQGQSYRRVEHLLGALGGVEETTVQDLDLERRWDQLESLNDLSRTWSRLTRHVGHGRQLDEEQIPSWGGEHVDLLEDMLAFQDLRRSCDQLESQIESIDEDIDRMHKQIHALLEDAGVCPVCRREVDAP